MTSLVAPWPLSLEHLQRDDLRAGRDAAVGAAGAEAVAAEEARDVRAVAVAVRAVADAADAAAGRVVVVDVVERREILIEPGVDHRDADAGAGVRIEQPGAEQLIGETERREQVARLRRGQRGREVERVGHLLEERDQRLLQIELKALDRRVAGDVAHVGIGEHRVERRGVEPRDEQVWRR